MNWRKVGFSFFEIWESLWQASSMPAMLYALAQFLKISVARIPSSKNFEISTINMTRIRNNGDDDGVLSNVDNMGNGMNKVLPGLYIGNYQDSKDADQLERFEITHILAIHDTARRLHSNKHYLCILAADRPDQNLSQYFSLCNDFIHAARLRGGNVLIHCLAGMSRSVTVAVAYIMSTTNLSWKEALKVVRVGRSIANPNAGFQQQLEDFESSRLQEVRSHRRKSF
ncbi:hypothetical protein HZH66_009937 [Vespula vulgaris]|uniref:Dual specificity protein phosphatase 15 n=1 Tax=Vespula vulgaris TaxID=7454 RepID=A0A834MXE6_VESVU|nr:hypothetical protein HZH66_009937 [Vespula vulgaris]